MRVRVKMCTNKIIEEFTKMTKGGKRNVTIFVIVVVHSFKCQKLVAYIASHVQCLKLILRLFCKSDQQVPQKEN